MASPAILSSAEPRLSTVRERILTGKSLSIGLLAVIALNLIAPYSEWVVRSTYMTTNYFPLGLAFSFIMVIVLVNPVMKLVSGGLSANELGVVLMMLLAAVSVSTYGITGYVISVSASPFYFSTTENGWAK